MLKDYLPDGSINKIDSAKFVIVGTGGHASSVLDILESNELFPEFLVSDSDTEKEKWGIPVIPESRIEFYSFTHKFVLGLGSLNIRSAWLSHKHLDILEMPTVYHRSSYISNRTNFGIGSTIHSLVHVGPGVKVGDFCIINSGVTIDHDVKIGNNVIISPGATIAGGSCLGDGTFVGMGALVTENTTVGEFSVIGANSFVNKNVPANSRVFGTPGRLK